MKAYLTGPRLKQTVNIRGVMFVEGVAEINKKSSHLERYYGVVYDKPEEYEDNTLEESESVEVENDDLLLQYVVRNMKSEMEQDPDAKFSWVDKLSSFKNFGEAKQYVKQKTGYSPRDKKQAVDLLTKYCTTP